jgi:putative aldouronate transport system substrate-binding protein
MKNEVEDMKIGVINMKKLLSISLCIVIMILTLLSGCANTSSQPTPSSNKEEITDGTKEINSEEVSKYDEPGTFPLTEKKETLTIFAGLMPFVEDLETNDFTKWYEEKTNVHVEWDIVPVKNLTERRNVLLASGDYPDVFMNTRISSSQADIYALQGAFVPIDDLIEKYGVEFKKAVEKVPEMIDISRASDGKIYGLPDLNECYHCMYAQRMWINKTWLEKLNLKMPETTDDFYKVLKAFKDNDPNGNGKADEIPLAGAINGWSMEVIPYLMSSFIYTDRYLPYLEDGKIIVPYDKEGWKEGLKYINKLYDEGLLYPESFTMDKSQLKQLGENPDVPVLGAASAAWYGQFTTNLGDSGRYKMYNSAVPPLEGPNGVRTTYYEGEKVVPYKYIITKDCNNPELAFRWADWFYTQEATLRTVFGVPDKDWRYAEEGEIGLNGKQAIYTTISEKGQMSNKSWNQMAPAFRDNDFRLGQSRSDAPEGDQVEVVLYQEAKEKYEPYSIKENWIPPVMFTEDESAEYEDLKLTIENYVKQSAAQFITGVKDIEKGWDSYVKELENIGVDRYLELYQNAYDRKYKK